ncbi:MAG: DNA-binding response regulator [Alphaproteobacteria bacterium]|nr:MAG: DNA-binding response regulator [Alphaproteobacteria bacterium]
MFWGVRKVAAMHVLIADDHGLFREGCKLLLQELDPKASIAEASDFNEVQEILKSQNDFDLILLDLKMPGLGEIEGLRRTRELAPATPIVVVSALEDPYYAQRVMSSGAAGYIPKSANHSVIFNAIKLILAGGHYVPPDLMSSTGTKKPNLGDAKPGKRFVDDVEKVLTPRQLDVMRHLAKGDSNKKIAEKLGLSEGTVKVHVAAILKALNAANRTQAVIMASGFVRE